MPLTYSSYTGDGSQTSFSITFDYLADTVVTGASPAGILVYLGDVKQTSGYTVNATTVDFASAPGAGVAIQLVRSTPRGRTDRLVDFADATVLTEDQLDTSALQLLYIAQEAFEQSTSGGGATPTYLPYSNTLTAWDAESQKISRVATPSSGTDAVNKTYADEGFLPYDASAGTYDAARSGANKKIDGIEDPQDNQQAATKKYVDDVAQFGVAGVPQSFEFTGDGATNTFTLANLPFAQAEMLVVGLNGVLQVPVRDYTVTRGATNSTLNFVAHTPGSGDVLSVLNFGRARFLDEAVLGDESITTEMLQGSAVTTAKILDANVTSAKLEESQRLPASTSQIVDLNVTTEKLADDAVTSAKIADDSVDFARLKDTGFLDAINSSATAKVLRVNNASADLSLGTLAAADITDFNSSVTVNPVSAFGAATGDVNLNGNYLIGLPTPTQSQHAATKAYVDGATQSAFKGTLITDTTLASAAGSFTVDNWFDDSKFLYYEVHCMNFGIDDTSGNPGCLGLLLKDSSGVYRNDFNDYFSQGTGATLLGSGRNGVAAPTINNLREAHFTMHLRNNNSLSAGRKFVQSEGIGATGGTGAGFAKGTVDGVFNIVTKLAGNSTIQGLRFRCVDQANDTAPSGNILSGARVLVYGYEGLS